MLTELLVRKPQLRAGKHGVPHESPFCAFGALLHGHAADKVGGRTAFVGATLLEAVATDMAVLRHTPHGIVRPVIILPRGVNVRDAGLV